MGTTASAYNPNEGSPYPDATSLTTNEILNQLTGGPTIAPRASPFPNNIGALQVANKLALNPPAPGGIPPAMNPGVSLAPPTIPEPGAQTAPLSSPSAQSTQPVQSAPLSGLSSSNAESQIPPVVSASADKSQLGGIKTNQPYTNEGMEMTEQAQKKLAESLDKRVNGGKDNFLGLDPRWLALAQGFLAPTRTGSFGEALGNAAGAIGKANETEKEQERKDLMARIELGKAMSETQKQKDVQKVVGDLYSGPGNTLSMEKARMLAQITGDPKILQDAINQQRQLAINDAGSKMFAPKEVTKSDGTKETKFVFDPEQLNTYARLSGDSLAAYDKAAGTLKNFKAQGLMNDLSDQGTPFDSLYILADQMGPAGKAYKDMASKYAKMYPSMDQEKAATLANNMLNQMNSHFDRETAMNNTVVNQQMTRAIMQQGADMRRDALNQKIKEANDKADEKETKRLELLKQQEGPLKNLSAQVEVLRSHPGRTAGTLPLIGGIAQSIPATDARAFGNELKVIQSQQFMQNVNNMRGLGSLSNAEGQKITSLIASLDPQMKAADFDKALDTIQKYTQNGLKNIQRQANGLKPVFLEPDELGPQQGTPKPASPKLVPKENGSFDYTPQG